MIEFLGEMQLVGWLGLLLWFALPILIIATHSPDKNSWFTNFYERMPQFEVFTDTFGSKGEGAMIFWLVARLFIMQFILMVIGFIIMSIFR